MDTSTSPVQSTPNAQATVVRHSPSPAAVAQPGSLTQLAADPGAQSAPPAQPISVHPEQGPVQNNAAENNEDEVQPARQEVSTKPVQAVAEIEVKPSMPEVAIEKSVEHVIEKSPDVDKPKIPEILKSVGVTHSGPGIPINENAFHVKSLPMTYDQAVIEEKQHPKLNDSKHWLAELVIYVWRKLDPTYGKKKGEKQENKALKVLN